MNNSSSFMGWTIFCLIFLVICYTIIVYFKGLYGIMLRIVCGKYVDKIVYLKAKKVYLQKHSKYINLLKNL